MLENKIFKVTYSKAGLPCLCESGGGMSSTGECQLVADPNGNPKKAIYVFTRGELACVKHAVIPVRKGDVVLTLSTGRDTCDYNRNELHLWRLAKLTEDNFEAYEIAVEPKHFNMIEAGYAKCNDYHCRTPYFIEG